MVNQNDVMAYREEKRMVQEEVVVVQGGEAVRKTILNNKKMKRPQTQCQIQVQIVLTGEGGSGQVNVTAMALGPSAGAGESLPPFRHYLPSCSVIILKIRCLLLIPLPLQNRWLEGWFKE